MKLKFAMCLMTLGLLTAALPSMAQEKETKETKPSHQKVRTLTGCLAKGEGSDEYNLTTKNGGTWEVRGEGVSLADHVGHTVTVTGAVSHPDMHGMKEDAKSEMKEHDMKKSDKEHGHLTATDVKMVSDSCQK
jgi:hypothetical protein